MSLLSALARVALGTPFIVLGYQAAKEPGGRTKAAAAFGIPEEYADQAVRLNGGAMVAGGLAMALGIAPRLGALTVAGALLPTTLAGHPFWKGDEQAKPANQLQALKNLGLLGGLLAVAATPRAGSDQD